MVEFLLSLLYDVSVSHQWRVRQTYVTKPEIQKLSVTFFSRSMERKIKKTELPVVKWNNLKVGFVAWTLTLLALVSLWHSDHPHFSSVGINACICTIACLCSAYLVLFHSETLQCFFSWIFVFVFYLLGWPLLLTSWVSHSLLKISEVISRLFWRVYLIQDNPPYSVY